jgi:hypothetical protein
MTKSHAQLEGGDTSIWYKKNPEERRVGNESAVLRAINYYIQERFTFEDLCKGLQLNADTLQITPIELLRHVEVRHLEDNQEPDPIISDVFIKLRLEMENNL